MRIEQQIIDQKIEQVPENIREAVFSESVAEELSAIAKEENLHLDQAGIIEEETLYLMLGLTGSDKFLEEIKDRLGLSSESAARIAQKINDRMIMPIRQRLQDAENSERPENVSQTEMTKENILDEIENPAPAVHPISSVDQTIPGPSKPREIVSERPDQVTKDFIGGKLTETVTIPSEKVNLGKDNTEQKPKTYQVDPYRESIE